MTVRGAKFSFEKNSKVLLLASKDMGKTTLLKALSGFDETYLGNIKFEGRELKEIDDGEKNFSLLLDSPVFFEGKSIRKNFDYLCETIKREKLSDEELVSFLQSFGIESKPETKISKLTLFEKRILQLARSEIKNPNILFLDDQFEGLEEQDVLKMKEQYEKILNKNKTMIVAFSDASFKFCKDMLENVKFQKVLYLCDGELFVFSSVKNFENSLVRKNALEFVDGYEKLSALIFRAKDAYVFSKEDVREIEIDKKFNKKLDELKLEVGETEKVSLFFKGEFDFENIDEVEFNKRLSSDLYLIYSDLDGKKVF